MTAHRPAEVFPPGEFLREELDARGWTQADLAEIIGCGERSVSEIVTGKRGMSIEMANGLGVALGTGPEVWLNLEQAYQLWRAEFTGSAEIARRAKLFSYAPVKEMIRRQWIAGSESVDVLEQHIKRFFEVPNLEEEPELVPHAARKSTSYTERPTRAQLAWLFRARQMGESMQAPLFTKKNIEGVLRELRAIVPSPSELHQIPRILRDAGIRFVVVEHLKGTRIDGACVWLNVNAPIIAMSLRYDRIDNFWFCLLHELGHCKQGLSSLDLDLDNARDNSERSTEEKEADEFAVQHLVDQNALNNFIVRKHPLYSRRHIEAFALVQRVHPGIVVGQLQYRGKVKYENFRKLLEPIRDNVISTAYTDGWDRLDPPSHKYNRRSK